jgi:hypothetical protein
MKEFIDGGIVFGGGLALYDKLGKPLAASV